MRALFLDMGNTALKWRYHADGIVRQGDAVHRRDWSCLGQIEAIDWRRLERIEVASVAGREADPALAEAIAALAPVRPRFTTPVAKMPGLLMPTKNRIGSASTVGWR